MQAARTMMQAGAAMVRAGGAGVFIDNSALAHGGQHWLEMTEDGGPDALSFAFVAIVRGKADVWTMGMHVLGLRDIVMKRADVEAGGFDIVEVIRYLAGGEKPIDDGHVHRRPERTAFSGLHAGQPREPGRKSHAQSLRTFEAGEHAGYRRDQLVRPVIRYNSRSQEDGSCRCAIISTNH